VDGPVLLQLLQKAQKGLHVKAPTMTAAATPAGAEWHLAIRARPAFAELMVRRMAKRGGQAGHAFWVALAIQPAVANECCISCFQCSIPLERFLGFVAPDNFCPLSLLSSRLKFSADSCFGATTVIEHQQALTKSESTLKGRGVLANLWVGSIFPFFKIKALSFGRVRISRGQREGKWRIEKVDKADGLTPYIDNLFMAELADKTQQYDGVV
jgi:hypothetical protein